MKRKFSKILGLGLTLALLASMLVMATPVAADVSTPTVTLDKSVVSLDTEYTIEFTVQEGLSADTSSITVTFPDDTTVKETGWGNGEITVGAAPVVATNITVADVTEPIVGQAVTFITPALVPAHSKATVVFTLAAGIKNPSTAGTYQLYVCTDAEPTDVPSEEYSITAPPGPVDVYNADDPMVYQAHYDTITLALEHSGLTTGWTLSVHADTDKGGNYNSALEDYPLVLDEAGVTVESCDGAASTTIDASATGINGVGAAVQITVSGVTLGSGEDAGFTIIAPDGDITVHGINRGIDISYISGDDVDNVTIDGNVITGDTLSPQLGILIGAYPFNGHTEDHANIRILNNTFHTTWGYQADALNPTSGGIKSAPASTLSGDLTLIDNNTIPDFFVGINLCGPVLGESEAPVIISNNKVTGSDCNGIEVGNEITNLTICGNQIYDNGGNGVAISGGAVTNLKVEQNDIYNNGNGVKVYAGVTGVTAEISINYNDIHDNTNTTVADRTDFPDAWTSAWASYQNYGVWNASAGSDLHAKYNFWGEIGGPDSSGVTGEWVGTALGMGDIAAAVATSTVIYNPWLSVSYVTVVDEGKRYYGSDTLTLQAGWNTLSVPLELYDLADSITEIEAMGDFLTAANYADYIVEYVPGEGFLTPETLAPCRGYYIKMEAASNFPVLYCNSIGLPALELTAGWNLIGSAFGIDKLGTSTWAAGASDETGTHDGADDAATVMTDSTAAFIGSALVGLTIVNETDGCSGVITANAATTVTVASLAGGTDNDWDTGDIYSILDAEAVMAIGAALDSIGDEVSAVISPSVPGQIGDPWSVIWAPGDTDNKMYTGEGYWVFMTDTGTLAGWEITPFYFNP